MVDFMKRLMKAIALGVRYIASRLRYARIYYWAERRLFDLRSVRILPDRFYCLMFRVCMRWVNERRFLGFADWMIHRIPFDVRCNLV